MGVWIEVCESEPISTALRRFRKMILAEGAFPLHHCKWHKKRHDCYLKPSVLRRRRRWLTKVARRGCKIYNPDPDYDWADDLEFRPRRSWGRLGPHVVT
jgi:ribosomal protein S21